MSLQSIVNKLSSLNLINELIERSSRSDRLILKGTSRTTKSLIVSSITNRIGKNLVIIVPTIDDGTKWLSLLQLAGWDKSILYPSSEASPYEYLDPTSEIVWGQLQVLTELLNNDIKERIAIVATERSLQPHLPPPKDLLTNCIIFRSSETYDMEEISKKLVNIGYKRLSSIENEGTWSRRGDIIDIYPVSNELPIRLEFFGSELEKIKEFDPGTQRSIGLIKEVLITPTNFNPLIIEKLKSANILTELNLTEEDITLIEEGIAPEGISKYLGLAWEEPSSLLEYLPKDSYLVVDERDQSIINSQNWYKHAEDSYKEILNANKNYHLIKPTLHKDPRKCFSLIEDFEGLDLTSFDKINFSNTFEISNKILDSIPNQFGKLSELIKEYQRNKVKVWILSAQPSRAVTLLEEHECVSKFIQDDSNYKDVNDLIEENIPIAIKSTYESDVEGFYLPSFKIALITDKEFFGQRNIFSSGYIRRRKGLSSKKIDPNKMTTGDYVVHRNHGIGLFKKIEKLALNGDQRDYLVIEYLDGKLRVAADQLGSLCRYKANTNKKPNINKLGGISWFNTKERAKKAVNKIALDLVRLYAERSEQEGFSYPPDGPWQRELEDSFPYEATPDQKKAVLQVKIDMEKNKPMDRLVCGDVGFGKTEVAIRAIFKAVTSGKQIAFLAPTTILSQQHWRTISDRFAPYPIKVSLLNRFKTSEEKRIILEGLKSGKIDIVIGTHLLLNKKVEFKELGLLVVDEEQRFGVNQKEKIKIIRKNIDVLTLSATPIPRTLYMSLSGVREMSLINTPPPQRRPIKTHLMPLDNEAIRSAICQEIDRGGQVFYVVPRIEGIEEVSIKLKGMVPNLSMLIAHGQMAEGQLENAMVAFNSGECDLMLCTTIIESGLDIPRVNTIIIEDSHKFGLSQLYQLRGRVGRSGIQAHAWLFFPNNNKLNESARQRLKAIQEFSELGSGYQLAMRDMEIRGVGNILGIEQSGQIETIGFELYMELLQECLSEIQGQKIPKVEEAQIDLQITAFIPGDWIIDGEEKISAYRSATNCNSESELYELAASWIDRYGTLPKPVESLLEIMKLKIKAKSCGFSRIKSNKQNIELETLMDEPAFRLLKKGMPTHLHNRLIYKKGDTYSTVIARGLGVINTEKQLSTISDWLNNMLKQVAKLDKT